MQLRWRQGYLSVEQVTEAGECSLKRIGSQQIPALVQSIAVPHTLPPVFTQRTWTWGLCNRSSPCVHHLILLLLLGEEGVLVCLADC